VGADGGNHEGAIVKTNSTIEIESSSTHIIVPEAPPAPKFKIEDLCSTLANCEDRNSYLGYLADEANTHYELRLLKDCTNSIGNYELISLENLLANTNRSKLSRRQRYRLAVVLASSVLQLQTTPWLTEKLEKKNIYFYRSETEILADQPYILQSFSSKKIFHPMTSDEESTPPALFYSKRISTRSSLVQLGIVLLELCFGQPIEKQTELRSQYLMDGKAHNDTDYLTARDWIYEVGEEAGEEFEKAVKCCVLCNFDAKLDWEDANFTQLVYAGVVEPLEKLYTRFG
jgi:hypothetical protein